MSYGSIPNTSATLPKSGGLFKQTRTGHLSFSSESLSTLVEDQALVRQTAQTLLVSERVLQAQSTGAGGGGDGDGEEAATHLIEYLEEDKGLVGQAVHNELDSLKVEFFRLGLTTGASLQMFIITFFLLFISSNVDVGPLNELSKEYYPVFRMVIYIVWFFSLYGVVLFVLKRYHVDYFTILNLPKEHTYQFMIQGAASTAYIVFMCFMLYVLIISRLLKNTCLSGISKHFFPALALILPAGVFLWPVDKQTRLCYGVEESGSRQRYNLLKQIAAVLMSPFSESTRLRGIIADIFCSMPKVFSDMVYTVYLYKDFDYKKDVQTVDNTGMVFFYLSTYLMILPYLIRLMQTVRECWDKPETTQQHTFNLCKYTLSVCVTLLNLAQKVAAPENVLFWRAAWQGVAVFTTIMSYYADVVLNWGLGNANSKNWMLRDALIFPKWSYYFAIVVNFLLRLCWAINISPGQPWVAQNFALIIGCAELFRRNLWLIFRIESISIAEKVPMKRFAPFVRSMIEMQQMGMVKTQVPAMPTYEILPSDTR